MMLNLKRLHHLVTVADEANFSRAADRLGITQPALSRSIADTERACGLRLFDRNRAGVVLTSAGTDLVAEARRLLGQVGAIEQTLLLQSRGEAGRIDFGIGPLTANHLMANLLAESVAERPRLQLHGTIAPTAELIAGVLDGTYDFVICAAGAIAPHPALTIREIGRFHLGYFVRSGHPLAQRQAVQWPDLLPYPRASGKVPPPSNARLFQSLGATVACDDFEALRRLTLRSDAIWLTSARLITTELEADALCEIHPVPAGPPIDAEIVLVTVHGRTQSPAVRHVIATAIRLMRD
jgi:LysR family transcriptional regulator, pca operon transcriptional activator